MTHRNDDNFNEINPSNFYTFIAALKSFKNNKEGDEEYKKTLQAYISHEKNFISTTNINSLFRDAANKGKFRYFLDILNFDNDFEIIESKGADFWFKKRIKQTETQ